MSILEKIDNYFYEKPSKKEFYYILGLIIAMIGFGFYYYIFPIAEDYHKKEEKRFQSLNNSIRNTQRDITLLKVRRVKLIKEEKDTRYTLKELKKDRVVFSQLVNVLDFAQFNRLKWARIVKNIIKDAKKDALEVMFIENQLLDEKSDKLREINMQISSLKKRIENLNEAMLLDSSKSAFYLKKIGDYYKEIDKLKKAKEEVLKNYENMLIHKKMKLGLDLKGDYINFIHFIYRYEDIKDLIRVSNIQIGSKINIKKSKNKNSKKEEPKNEDANSIHYYVEFIIYGYER